MKFSRFHLSLIIIFVGYSCSIFNRPNFPVEQYEFSGLRVVFADLEDSYKRSKNFNKIWSKIHKNKYRPYFRFAGKSYIVDGILNKYKQGFLILKDENGNQFKMELNQEEIQQKIIPSYLLTEDIDKKALGMIDCSPEEKAKSAKTAMIFSRTNTLLSLPMLLSMVAAQNLY